MAEVVIELEALSKRAVKRFVRTAVLIDDEIESANDAAPAIGDIVAPAFSEAPEPAFGEREVEAKSVSDVSLKPLADAFLDRQIVCGVLKPSPSDDKSDVIKRAVSSARVADVLIIDWYLRKGDPEITKSILLEVLKSDSGLNGRFRLVIVYTSEAPLEDRREELQKYLEAEGIYPKPFEGAAPSLKLNSCRICFVKKSDGFTGKTVDELPDFAITEFSEEAKGLMPAYALNGIAALRETAHHLLATFSSKLDPAFVGHRLLTGDEDAQEFALNLLMFQIRGLLSLPAVSGASLDNGEISSWIDYRFSDDAAADALAKIGVTKEELKAALSGEFNKNEKKVHSALFIAPAGSDAVDEAAVCSDFSRLSTFVRERDGFNPLPVEWLPTLTLGSLVKTRSGNKVKYFLCIQPLCDTVRLKSSTFFSFVELINDKKDGDFWISAKIREKIVHLRLDKRAPSRHYAEFEPNKTTGSVRAARTKANTEQGARFTFTSKSGAAYEWIGDVDRSKSQKAAVDVSTSLARVGIDEYEWLRRGGKAK